MSVVVRGGQQSSVAVPLTAASPYVDGAEVSRTLTVEQAARYLGISRSTAYECVRNGSLPSLRFRRRIVIPTIVVDRLLASVANVEGAEQTKR